MKKLLVALVLAFAFTAPTTAQTERISPTTDRASNVERDLDSDIARMVRSQYNLDLRKLVIESLALNQDEIASFDRHFNSYMSEKNMLMNKRQRLVDRYNDEMAEDDTAKDEENETADFIENYWEVDIDEMELKKDYFDMLEDEIGSERALRFFAMEEMYGSRLKRMALLKSMPIDPVVYILEPVTYTYEREMNDYNNWNKVNITGRVGLDHNFTYNGLEKLMNATQSMAMSEGINVNNFTSRKNMIMDKAGQLKKDWTSLNHADLARAAFTETAAIMNEIAMNSRFSANTTNTTMVNKLRDQAKMINPDVKLTDQADAVYNFFDTAQVILNDLVDQANRMPSSRK